MTINCDKPRDNRRGKPAKTLDEKLYEKFAPASPMPYDTMERAWRAEMNLRRAVGEAERLLKSRRDGENFSLGGEPVRLSSPDRDRLFDSLLGDALKQIAYWEFYARLYVELTKDLEQKMQSVRLVAASSPPRGR